MGRYGLRDDQWDRIRHLLPGSEGWVGVTAVDNRRFVEAVLYRYRAGYPGAICQNASGIGKTCTGASAGGRSLESGSGSSSISRPMPTTNMR